MKADINKTIYLSIILSLFMVFYAEASIIRDFSEIKYSGNLIINASSLNITNSTDDFMRIDELGNVGIGMTPTVQFELSGSVSQKASGTTWSNPSDFRIKDVIKPFSDGIDVLKEVNPIWYKFNGKGGIISDGKEHIGVVAQDIQKVAPYMVSSYKAKLNDTDTSLTDLLRFDASALTFITINAVKEQQTEIEFLKSELCKKDDSYSWCASKITAEQPVQPAEQLVIQPEEPVNETPPVESPVTSPLETPIVNSVPVIDSFMPEVVPVMSVGESQEFTIKASDADSDDVLSVQWYVNNLPIADQTQNSFTFAGTTVGEFEVKVLVTDSKDYVTHKWAVTVEQGTGSFSITGAAVGVAKQGSSLWDWLKSLF